MLREATLLKINTAIRACLDRCYGAESPLAAMAQFLADLRRRPEWKQAEVEEVEVTVRRILQAVVTRQTDSSASQAGLQTSRFAGRR